MFRLNYENATTLVPVLRPLIAPNNTISANPGNNSLVITDYADNLRRLQRIIEALDSPQAADVEIVPLKHGLAVEMASIIGRMLDDSARGGQAVDAGQRVTISAEPRTNTLVLRTASPARRQLAKTLIERLDQPSATPGNINVIYLRNAEAVKLAPTLRAIISSDPSFLPQTTSAGLSTTGPGGQQTGAQGGFPAIAGQAGAPQPLQQQTTFGTSPGTTGAGGSAGAGGPLSGLIQADAATNSLIITAPEPLYRNLRTIIEKLDTRRAQVNIETLIVEVNADKAAELGVQWQALEGLNSDGYARDRRHQLRRRRHQHPERGPGPDLGRTGPEPRRDQGHDQHPGDRRDHQPRFPRPRAADRGQRQRALAAEHPGAGQRGSQVPRRPERALRDRFVHRRPAWVRPTRSRPSSARTSARSCASSRRCPKAAWSS